MLHLGIVLSTTQGLLSGNTQKGLDGFVMSTSTTEVPDPWFFCSFKTCDTQACMYGEIFIVAGIAIMISALLTTRRHERRE